MNISQNSFCEIVHLANAKNPKKQEIGRACMGRYAISRFCTFILILQPFTEAQKAFIELARARLKRATTTHTEQPLNKKIPI